MLSIGFREGSQENRHRKNERSGKHVVPVVGRKELCEKKKKKKTANLQKCREVVNVGGGENWTRKMSEWTLQHLQILANTDSARLSRVV